MRVSELRGLAWEAVNLKAGTITVKQRADRTVYWAPPRARLDAALAISATVVELLRRWKLECPSGSALVFPNWQGNIENLPNIHTRCWRPVQLAAGVVNALKDEKGRALKEEDGKPIVEPRYNFHSLRHFHASRLIADGANPKDVQIEMGHVSIAITYDLYGHLFHDEAAEQRRSERAQRLAAELIAG